MRIVWIWIGMLGCAALGVAAAFAVADYTAKSETQTPFRAVARSDQETEVAQAIAGEPEPAASPPETLPAAPPVSAQLGSIVSGIQEVTEKLTTQQQTLLETLQSIQEQSRQQEQENLQQAEDRQLPRTEQGEPAGDGAGAIGGRPLPVIEAEGDNRLRINIQDADIRDVLEMLSRQGDLNILPSPDVTGTVNATLSGVTIDEALQAILQSAQLVAYRQGKFIFVGTPESISQMQNTSEPVDVRIFRPNYVTAADLQALIAPLLSTAGQATVAQTRTLGRSSRVAVSSPAEVGIPTDPNAAGGDAFAGNEVVIVRDYPNVLRQIEAVVREVDQRPRQVAIEAIIIGVRLDDSNSLGVNFELLRNKQNVRLISGSPLDNLASIDVSSGGLKFGFLDGSLAAFIDALETIGDTNVVASPRVVCLNKQRAEILIGSQLGYVSTTVTENSATQSVEFLEVGTQLRIRPFISDERMIRLEVHPELSTGSVRVEQGMTLPDKEVTQVTTNVLCPDGKTLVIGGLIREDLTTTSSHIPYLGRAPLIGPLFRRETETTERREILICLTPRIIDDPWACEEDAEATAAFLRRQAIYADKMSVLGTRSKGRLYLRLAKSAWQAGDLVAAFRYVQVALHFDPDNLEAVNLRTQIIRVRPDLDLPIRRRLREGLPAWERPMRNYSKDGFRWQDPINVIPGHGSAIRIEDVEAVEEVAVPTPAELKVGPSENTGGREE